MIENSAKAEDLFLLKERMKQWEAQGFVLSMAEQLFDGQYLQLGEVQPAYASFISVLKDYASFVKQDYYTAGNWRAVGNFWRVRRRITNWQRNNSSWADKSRC